MVFERKKTGSSDQLELLDGGTKGYTPETIAYVSEEDPIKVINHLRQNLDHVRDVRDAVNDWYASLQKDTPKEAAFKIWMDLRDCKILLKEWLFSGDARKQAIAVRFLNTYILSEKMAAQDYFATVDGTDGLQALDYFKTLVEADDEPSTQQ